jgi:hypothetical protein
MSTCMITRFDDESSLFEMVVGSGGATTAAGGRGRVKEDIAGGRVHHTALVELRT